LKGGRVSETRENRENMGTDLKYESFCQNRFTSSYLRISEKKGPRGADAFMNSVFEYL